MLIVFENSVTKSVKDSISIGLSRCVAMVHAVTNLESRLEERLKIVLFDDPKLWREEE